MSCSLCLVIQLYLFAILLETLGSCSDVRLDCIMNLKDSPFFIVEPVIISSPPDVPESSEEGQHLFISDAIMEQLR